MATKEERKRRARERAKESRRISRARGTMSAVDRALIDAVVTPEAQAAGDHHVTDFKVIETVVGGKTKAHTTRVIRNRGGSPIDRWHANGGLDDRQMAAIYFYSRAWHLVFQEPRVVAKWSAVHTFGAMGAVEVYSSSRIAARTTLRMLDNEIFFRLDSAYFQVFQNVVIFDEPGGVAGGRAGFTHKAAEGAARATVSMVASMIADIVIDGARTDYDLPEGWDTDAPRKVQGRRVA